MEAKQPTSKLSVAHLNTNRINIPEQEAVRIFCSSLEAMGLSKFDATAIWIGLKSKPGMIIQCAQHELSNRLATKVAMTLLGSHPGRFIRLQGHPWWARPGIGQSYWADMQSRLNASSLRSFLGRALQKRERSKLHFILLEGISRAELHLYYLQFPAQSGNMPGLSGLPWRQSLQLIEANQHIFLMVTEGQPLGLINDPGPLRFNTIIQLPDSLENPAEGFETAHDPFPALESSLTAFRDHNARKARALIPRRHLTEALCVAGEALALMEKYKLKPIPGLFKDAYLFIGHSWDLHQEGIFSRHIKSNILQASDFWLRQAFIPRIWPQAKRRSVIQAILLQYFHSGYPRAEHAWRQLMEVFP
jgi:hypothetical protein